MASVGELVQEAVDSMNSGFYEMALVPASLAISQTSLTAFGNDSPSDFYLNRFLNENWQLIAFMGMPRALPLPLSIPFGLKRLVPSFSVHGGAFEIVSYVINETIRRKNMPDTFAFNTSGRFEIRDQKLLLPVGLVCGLLGSVIFHPSNKNETIGDKYWINISDFKMFVSELFGRQDLAQRIMKFYLG